jgi:hypothetical protein
MFMVVPFLWVIHWDAAGLVLSSHYYIFFVHGVPDTGQPEFVTVVAEPVLSLLNHSHNG